MDAIKKNIFFLLYYISISNLTLHDNVANFFVTVDDDDDDDQEGKGEEGKMKNKS